LLYLFDILSTDRAVITRVLYLINRGIQKELTDGQELRVRESDNIILTCTIDTNPLASAMLLDKKDNVISESEKVTIFTHEFKQVSCDRTGQYIIQSIKYV